jgi:hypothetical protein
VSAFVLALFGVLLAGLGGRDQMMLAGLVRTQGPRPGALVVAIAMACATAALAAWLSQAIAAMLNANARLFFAALALGFAGAESLLLTPGRRPEEPTRSLFALGLVVAAHQLTDAARFLVFAAALVGGVPTAAALGGAVGGAMLLAAAWSLPEWFHWKRLRLARRATGAALLALALWLGTEAMRAV